MFKRQILAVLCFLMTALLVSATGSDRNSPPDDKIVGRWDMTIQEANGGSYPSWFEVTREGEKFTGRFVGRVGSQRPIASIEFAGNHLKFGLPIQYERQKSPLTFEA